MKKIFLFSICVLFSSMIYAQTQLNNFDQMMSAFKTGKSVKAVIYYGKCKLFSEGIEQTDTINAIGGMELSTYEYFDSSVFKGKVPSFVTSSQTILISHPTYGYVYNYVKIKIRIDNTLEITARYLKPKMFSSKFKVVMDETFKGRINDGSNDGGVMFFAE